MKIKKYSPFKGFCFLDWELWRRDVRACEMVGVVFTVVFTAVFTVDFTVDLTVDFIVDFIVVFTVAFTIACMGYIIDSTTTTK